MTLKCLLYTWEDIVKLCEELARKIKESGYRPDVIVAVARGGWVPARILCDHLDVRELYSVKTEHWGVVATPTGEAKITQPLNVSLKGKRVLIVDDVADTGDTIKVVAEHVKSLSPAEVKIAVIDYKKTSKFEPHYYAALMEEWRWIVYPWSIREDLKDLLKRREVKNVEEALDYLRSLDLEVDRKLVEDVITDC
ncbi:MAG: phosphoribosyltransferase [Archaeoglobaceae archaeon]